MRKTANKWDKLGIELKNFMKENLNSDNTFDKSVSQLLKEFSELHHDETTLSSIIYYYYSDVKSMLEDEIISESHYYESESDKPKIVQLVKMSDSDRDEVASMIGYIESKTDYIVSDDAKAIIEEMIENLGVIETLIAIFDSIENVENINMFDIIVRSANEKPLN